MLSRYLLEQVGARHFDELQEQMLQIPSDAGGRERLLHMLDVLEAEVRLRSGRTASELVGRLRRNVSTESGRPIDGVTVLLSREQRLAWRTAEFDPLDNVDVEQDLHRLDEFRLWILEG